MKMQYLLSGVFACALLASRQPALAAPAPEPVIGSVDRFDDSVRDDFFDGMLHGDQTALARGMKTCDEALARNPRYAPAMAWHGNGLLFLSGSSFQAGDIAKGIDLWQRGLAEVNKAVALDPESLQVLIPRGATFLSIAKYSPNPAERHELLQTGVGDYEKVLGLQKAYFSKVGIHARGELLFGLANGWYQLGDREKSRAYLQRIVLELPGSAYATRAADWLQTTDPAALRKKSRAVSCIGCHGD